MGSECAILGFEPPLTDGVADDEDGLLEGERLFHEIVRAQFDRAHRRFDVAVTRNHHHGSVDAALAQPGEGDQTIHSRQPDIEHDDVVRRASHPVQAGLARLHRLDLVPFVSQHSAERAAHASFVVDDENRGLHDALR